MKSYKFAVFKFISAAFLMAICFFIVFYFMKQFNIFTRAPEELRGKGYAVIDTLYCLVFLGLLTSLEALAIGKRRLLDLCFGFFFSSLCVNIIFAAVMCIFIDFGFWRIVFWIAVFVVIQSSLGVIWIIANHRVYESVQFAKEAVFVYGRRDDMGELDRVNSTLNKYFNFTKTIDSSEGIDRILYEIEESSVVYLGDIPATERNVILKYCMKKRIDCYSIPKISDIYIQNSKVMQLNDKILLKYPPLEIERMHSFFKRALDIVLGALMLAASSPFMLVIAIAIKLCDHGPVLYKQERVTKDGREFMMYKFRSMRVDAEKDGSRLARKNDSRITPVGRVIRNIHFDELPQLINVLKGEMSLVGPRPERKEFIEEYTRVIPEFSERLRVKGGLTGYAQIYGRYNSTPEDKVKYDLYYIYNYSLWMDIKLLILTVRILFQKENTEGVEEWQISALKPELYAVPYQKEAEMPLDVESADNGPFSRENDEEACEDVQKDA